jgi:hypothetical protein
LHTIGRNDPCPCGSGKKYKHCCGAIAQPTPEMIYSKIRRLDGESSDRLMKFAEQRYGESGFESALEEFYLRQEPLAEPSGSEKDSFVRWFLFNWRPFERETLAELFLLEKKSALQSDVIQFIRATAQSPYSFFQTIEVDPGVSLTLRDILRKCDFHVYEKSASTILQKGHIMFARVVEMDGIHFLMGSGSLIIPPTFLDSILRIRSGMEKDSSSVQGSVTAEYLLDAEDDLREIYFDIEEDVRNPKISMQNTDGDPLMWHMLTYKISSAEAAFHSLKDLEQKCTGATDDEMLADAKRSKSGALKEIVVRWLKKSKKSTIGDITLLATITITPSKLKVEANSEKRFRRVQREIQKRLGGSAELISTKTKTSEELLKEGAKKGSKPERKKNAQDRLLQESPEVKKMLKELTDKHWTSWPDNPLPGLRGKTPRQAVKDPIGRELLESMLMDFELRNHEQDDESLRVDVAKLRRELGMIF